MEPMETKTPKKIIRIATIPIAILDSPSDYDMNRLHRCNRNRPHHEYHVDGSSATKDDDAKGQRGETLGGLGCKHLRMTNPKLISNN